MLVPVAQAVRRFNELIAAQDRLIRLVYGGPDEELRKATVAWFKATAQWAKTHNGGVEPTPRQVAIESSSYLTAQRTFIRAQARFLTSKKLYGEESNATEED